MYMTAFSCQSLSSPRHILRSHNPLSVAVNVALSIFISDFRYAVTLRQIQKATKESSIFLPTSSEALLCLDTCMSLRRFTVFERFKPLNLLSESPAFAPRAAAPLAKRPSVNMPVEELSEMASDPALNIDAGPPAFAPRAASPLAKRSSGNMPVEELSEMASDPALNIDPESSISSFNCRVFSTNASISCSASPFNRKACWSIDPLDLAEANAISDMHKAVYKIISILVMIV